MKNRYAERVNNVSCGVRVCAPSYPSLATPQDVAV